MNKKTLNIVKLFLILPLLTISCLKFDDCISNVFENEDLFLDISIDGENIYLGDSRDNNIFPGLSYQIDTSRQDTMIFYFDCHYIFEGDSQMVSITVVEYANLSDVVNQGNGNLNYVKFDNLMYNGDYEYLARTSSIPDYSIDVRYSTADSVHYNVDTTAHNPEDFYFNINSHAKSSETDCYNRRFEWYTYTGTFGCRLVDPVSSDTLVISNGELRAVIAQYK